ncbi:ParB N-terminal domain-containing protein [Vibrio sp. PNB22_3_1]
MDSNFSQFIEYAHDNELQALAHCLPNKVDTDKFYRDLKQVKENSDTSEALELRVNSGLFDIKDIQTVSNLLDSFKARASIKAINKKSKDTNQNIHPAASDLPNTDHQSNKHDALQVTFTLRDGSTLTGQHHTIAFSDINEYQFSEFNGRNTKALNRTTLADIMPSIKEVGIREPIYTGLDANGNKIIIKGSRRYLCAKVHEQNVPAIDFGTVTPAQIIEISETADKTKRLHSIRETGLTMERLCETKGITSIKDLAKEYRLDDTPANLQKLRRNLQAATLSDRLLSCFNDQTSLTLRNYLTLNDLQNAALSEATLSKVRGLRRKLDTRAARALINPILEHRIDDELLGLFAEMGSPQIMARKIAYDITELFPKGKASINSTLIHARLDELATPNHAIDPKNLLAKTRKHLVELMRHYLFSEDDSRKTITITKPGAWLEGFLNKTHQDSPNINAAHNADMMAFLVIHLPKHHSDPKQHNESNPPKVAPPLKRELLNTKKYKVNVTQTMKANGKTSLKLDMKGLNEEELKALESMLEQHFQSLGQD